MSGAIETQGLKLGIQSVGGAVSVTFNSSTKKIVRAAGDWTTDYKVGMIVTTSDVDNKGPYEITAATATELTVSGGFMTTDAVAASFTITGYKPIGEIVDVTGPGGSASVIDVSHLGSTKKEKRMGLPDEGQVSFNMNFVPSDVGQVAFRAARDARTEQNFIIDFANDTALANATTAKFAGFALEFSVSGGVDDKVSGSATIEVTAAVTWSDVQS